MDLDETSGVKSRLLTLPLELLEHVASHLKTPELGNFRLTCKHIEKSLFNSFAREFFAKKQFMLTEFSLQALVDISKSRLGPLLRHVIIHVERPVLMEPSAGAWGQDAQINRNDMRHRVREEYDGHLSLIHSGQDVEMMAEAFSNLVNLDTVGIRDYDSNTRYRDAEDNIFWKSYGATTYKRETGISLSRPRRAWGLNHDASPYNSRLFLSVLRALGKSGTRPKSLQVILRHCGLEDHAFNVPKYVAPVVEPVLANLHTVFLDLDCDLLPATGHKDHDPNPCSSYLLRQFLSKLKRLEHLRLNFQLCHGRHDPEDFLLWLARDPPTSNSPIPEFPPPISLPNLQTLEIGMLQTRMEILLALIRKFKPTLRSISLHKVTLGHPATSEALERVNLWQKFFGQLSRMGLKLSRFSVSSLGQIDHLEHAHCQWGVTFKDSGRNRAWTGVAFDGALKDFKENAVVEWPVEHSDASMGDSEDMDDIMIDDDFESEDDLSDSDSDLDDDGL